MDAEEIDETEDDDRTKFMEQLQTIGSFGRQVHAKNFLNVCRHFFVFCFENIMDPGVYICWHNWQI